MRYVALILITIICAVSNSYSQNLKDTDLTGLWKGELYNDTNKLTYKYEIGISKTKGKLHGFSHTWFILDDKQYYGVKKVKVSIKDDKLIVEDDELISNNYPVEPAKGVRQLNVLQLSRDSVMRLAGPFSTNRTKIWRPLTGSINLERKDDHWQSALVPHLQELALTDQLSFLEDDVVLKANQQDFAKLEIKRKQSLPVSTIESRGTMPATNVELVPRTDDAKNTEPETDLKKESSKLNSSVAKEVKKENTKTTVKPAPDVKPSTEIASIKKGEREEKISSEVKPINKINTVDANKEPLVKATAIEPDTKVSRTENTAAKVEPANQELKKESTPNITGVSSSLPSLTQNISSPGVSGAATDIALRKTMVQQTVNFKSDSLLITLYDNGEVDGDTVSVLLNGNVIMAKQGLSTNAVRKTIYIDPSTDSIQLVMYAENLGSIAPNTGLLVVRDGKDLYEIRFSGDFQKNAAIIFRRKKI